jgi:hypothetical protein
MNFVRGSPPFWEKLKASKPTIPLSIGSAWPISSVLPIELYLMSLVFSCGEK